jgi:toxin-antitoxin system PIN domain toxin
LTAHLLDVNLLIALAWLNHVHHDVAHRWLGAHRTEGWATCPTTQAGFVRVSSNARAVADARTPAESIGLLRRIVALSDHVFWSDDVAVATSELVAPERLLGHRQVTDAHLVALALRHGGRLATLDAGVLQVVPPPHDAASCVVVVR